MKFAWLITFIIILIGVPLFLSRLPRQITLSPLPTPSVIPTPTPIILTTDNAQPVLDGMHSDIAKTLVTIDTDLQITASVTATFAAQ